MLKQRVEPRRATGWIVALGGRSLALTVALAAVVVVVVVLMGAGQSTVESSARGAAVAVSAPQAPFLRWWSERRGPSGLVISNVGDPILNGWAVLYDQMIVFDALRGRGMDDEALTLLAAVWDGYPDVDGLRVNAVHAAVPDRVAEWSTHVGPNAHLGRRCLEAHAASGQAVWLSRAVAVAEALRRRWEESGAPQGIPQQAPASSAGAHYAPTIGVEENLAALVFIEALRTPGFDRLRGRLRGLTREAYEPAIGAFATAFVSGRVSTFHASDVQGIALSTLGPAGLEDLAPGATRRLLAFVDHAFGVRGAKDELLGFDFTDRRPGPGVISPEWSAQVVEGWLRVADDARRRGDHGLADRLEARAGRVLVRLRRILEGPHPNRYAYLADGRSASPRGTWSDVYPAASGESVIGLAYVDALCHGRRPIGRLPTRSGPDGDDASMEPP
jgi:hypothetical protein